ncbi:hypothetical protein [Granulicella arctica]|uniref:hypothetical protein n=1 Tax=Granulicella arctica TaxID=940613 RepID=UPI0021DF7DD2|nr:hypothetical protein [Granulicella arctica]
MAPLPDPFDYRAVSQTAQSERVTQSFVATLAWVRKRPVLTAFEVLWRWVYGIPALLLIWHEGVRILLATQLDYAGLKQMTLLDPMKSSVTLGKAALALGPQDEAVAVWLVPLLLVTWVIVSSLGRTLVLQRADERLHARPITLMVLQAIRMTALCVSFMCWFLCLQWAAEVAVTGPIASNQEPSLVLYFGLAIVATLGLFTLWAVVSWGLSVAPLLAMLHGWGAWKSLRSSFRLGALKIKLVEINLVLGIVKIALIVLAMVFSASPLPFETVASQTFLTWWWCGVMVLYFIGSDFFHVARLVAYLDLWRASAAGAPDK